jgi:hypothetical protein
MLEQDTLVSSAQSGNQWYRYQEILPGDTLQKYVPVSSGDYSVIVISFLNNCPSQQSNIIPYYFAGINAKANDQNVNIYPNPFKDFVTISYNLPESGSILISLFDAVGKEITILENNSQQDAGQHSIVMKGQFLDKGLYYIKVQTKNYSISRKLILTK